MIQNDPKWFKIQKMTCSLVKIVEQQIEFCPSIIIHFSVWMKRFIEKLKTK